ncbi:MAG: hypothetical protein JWQ98_753 [Chlorobi bacterium]|nr:hypothetical protein [Chlorobiota bacterium]
MNASRYSPLIILFALVSAGIVSAQNNINPYFSGQGILATLNAARQQLAADATLVVIAAAGNTDFNTGAGTIALRFDPATGSSTVWAYLFYSPSLKQQLMLAGVDIPGTGMQAFPTESPFPIPAGLTAMLKTDLPFAGSNTLPARLSADSVYLRYHAELPGALPQTLAYAWMNPADSAMLPAEFPRTSPIWTIQYSGGGDSTMTCRVSGATGAIICARDAAATAPVDEHGRLFPQLTAAPNPVSGRVSVLVELPVEQPGDISVALYDAAGRLILHPVALARSGREYAAEFDLTRLPAGRYYCRARCAGWVGSVAIVR